MGIADPPAELLEEVVSHPAWSPLRRLPERQRLLVAAQRAGPHQLFGDGPDLFARQRGEGVMGQLRPGIPVHADHEEQPGAVQVRGQPMQGLGLLAIQILGIIDHQHVGIAPGSSPARSASALAREPSPARTR